VQSFSVVPFFFVLDHSFSYSLSTPQSSSQAPAAPSGTSDVGGGTVDVYVTLHHTGNPNEDILINAALLESIQGTL